MHPQFSLRCLFTVVAVLCVALAAWRWHTRHHRATRAIESLGGSVEWVTNASLVSNGYKPLSPNDRYSRVRLDEEWRGGAIGCRHLTDLARIKSLEICDAPGVSQLRAELLRSMTDLESLSVCGVTVSADAASAIHTLRGLQDVDICCAHIDMRVFRALGALRRLSAVAFCEANFRGDDLAFLNAAVERLDLRRTRVGDRDMAGLLHLHKLNCLILMDTDVSDEGLMQLSALQKLEWLSTAGSRVTPAGISRFRAAIAPRTCWVYSTEDRQKLRRSR